MLFSKKEAMAAFAGVRIRASCGDARCDMIAAVVCTVISKTQNGSGGAAGGLSLYMNPQKGVNLSALK